MQAITTIGLDIAKSVFQVHGVDAGGQAVIRRQLKRRYVLTFFQKLPSCLVGIEACASSHHWSRELQALGGLPVSLTTPSAHNRIRPAGATMRLHQLPKTFTRANTRTDRGQARTGVRWNNRRLDWIVAARSKSSS
jgi:hypothetical protein